MLSILIYDMSFINHLAVLNNAHKGVFLSQWINLTHLFIASAACLR